MKAIPFSVSFKGLTYYMKSAASLNADILRITTKIEHSFPELLKYLGEMPVKISNAPESGVNTRDLYAYRNSLTSLLESYAASHTSTIKSFLKVHSPTIKRQTMAAAKNIGIWMDYDSAHLMESTNKPMETITIESAFSSMQKVADKQKSESAMQEKEQHQQADYYKKVGDAIVKYDDVLLFGPTEAKVELFSLLRADSRFEKVKIKVKHGEKMTESQRHEFVKGYFSQKV